MGFWTRDPERAGRNVTCAAEAVAKRKVADVSEREMALSFVLLLAQMDNATISLMGFYDDDLDFIAELASRLDVADDLAFRRKLVRVARQLVRHGVLLSQMRGTYKEYLGEPAKTQVYWLKPGKAGLLTRGKTQYTMEPEWEASFLLRHAYPDPALSG